MNNPFKAAEGKLCHLYFCIEKPNINQEKMDKFQADTEEVCLIDNVFYLYAPNGIGRSKLVANMDACLGVPGTGRNLNTINKLSTMIDAL